jgi:hypothetical protein
VAGGGARAVVGLLREGHHREPAHPAAVLDAFRCCSDGGRRDPVTGLAVTGGITLASLGARRRVRSRGLAPELEVFRW